MTIIIWTIILSFRIATTFLDQIPWNRDPPLLQPVPCPPRLLHRLHFAATAIRQPHGGFPGIKDRVDLAQEGLAENPRKAGDVAKSGA